MKECYVLRKVGKRAYGRRPNTVYNKVANKNSREWSSGKVVGELKA